jgi:23S rRNA (guanosine2251-2'-O)-methyltransferase
VKNIREYKHREVLEKSRIQKRGAPRSRQDGGNGIYRITSWSGIAEYLRFKPEAIIDISVKQQNISKLKMLLSEFDFFDSKLVKVVNEGEEQESDTPVWASVKIKPKSEEALFLDMRSRSTDTIIALDHISDPRNLGAITRSCAFFGVKDIVAPIRRQVLLTPASVSTAQGGFALTNLTIVTNLSRFLIEAKKNGYWILGTDMNGEDLCDVVKEYDKMILVMGSEESGLSDLVAKTCDRVVKISPAGESLESLNVSVALGICLYARTC